MARLTNQEVVQAWLHYNTIRPQYSGGSEYGQNSGGTLYFEGDCIYSYGPHYCIARWTPGAVLLNWDSYSPTTTEHMALVIQHLPVGSRCIYVPNPRANSLVAHKENCELFELKLAELCGMWWRARTNKQLHGQSISHLVSDLNEYRALYVRDGLRAYECRVLVRAKSIYLPDNPRGKHYDREESTTGNG